MYIAISVVYTTLRLALEAFYLILVARAVLSWLPVNGGKIAYFVYAVTEPILSPVRRGIEKLTGHASFPIDLSVLFVFAVLSVLLGIF